MTANQASIYGMTPRSGEDEHGDGNFQIEFCNPGVLWDQWVGCENVLFWSDLSQANLIDGSFTTATDSIVANLAPTQVSLYFPAARIGKGNYIFAMYFNSDLIPYPRGNMFAISSVYSTDASGDPNISPEGISIMENYLIDVKIDDGYGFSGKVMTHNGNDFNSISEVCASLVPPYPYNTTTPDRVACHVLIYW